MSQAVPGHGGYYEELDWFGNTITWCAVTNWPEPYWNEWYYFIEEAIGPLVWGPYDEIWWYGEW